jgi:predicted metalloendopeptidase
MHSDDQRLPVSEQHAFDDDGSQYDARGELKEWWDKQTVGAFLVFHDFRRP